MDKKEIEKEVAQIIAKEIYLTPNLDLAGAKAAVKKIMALIDRLQNK